MKKTLFLTNFLLYTYFALVLLSASILIGYCAKAVFINYLKPEINTILCLKILFILSIFAFASFIYNLLFSNYLKYFFIFHHILFFLTIYWEILNKKNNYSQNYLQLNFKKYINYLLLFYFLVFLESLFALTLDLFLPSKGIISNFKNDEISFTIWKSYILILIIIFNIYYFITAILSFYLYFFKKNENKWFSKFGGIIFYSTLFFCIRGKKNEN